MKSQLQNSKATTLLLIDIQSGLDQLEYYGGHRNNHDAEEKMATILSHWRQKNWPVIHVKHNSTSANSPLRTGHPGNEIKDIIYPAPYEHVIEKNVNNAFIETSLLEDLKSLNVEDIVIIGLTTDHCVSTTARMAGNLGFKVKVISDATATFDKIGLSGEKYPADQVHNIALVSLNGEFCQVVNTQNLLSQL